MKAPAHGRLRTKVVTPRQRSEARASKYSACAAVAEDIVAAAAMEPAEQLSELVSAEGRNRKAVLCQPRDRSLLPPTAQLLNFRRPRPPRAALSPAPRASALRGSAPGATGRRERTGYRPGIFCWGTDSWATRSSLPGPQPPGPSRARALRPAGKGGAPFWLPELPPACRTWQVPLGRRSPRMWPGSCPAPDPTRQS
ncbi:hypothetical protein P7K49_035699 [Saguinus oedipus]|uniref:Uncharacterized protein n=1 Tax=Saguinus oedipus TaxID=9490 RepID=A0ABQ9TNL2_SAGOE|nr:hypothetical protein P7K49_035699 [Saguinus oedipus]